MEIESLLQCLLDFVLRGFALFDEIGTFDRFSSCFGIFGVLQCFKNLSEFVLIKCETQILEASI